MFLQNRRGKLVEEASLLPSPVPGTVHARKIIIVDFNSGRALVYFNDGKGNFTKKIP